MKYDLKDLITFTYVAKLRSFARAAEILKISRAIATNRISSLEKCLKMTLFTRTTREVNLTNEGKNFLKFCTEIVNKVEKIDDFIDYHKGINGTLRVVLPPYFSRYHIVPYLPEFLTIYPNLKLDISLTENPVNITSEGYDLQVRIQTPEEEDLEVVKIADNFKVVCASPKYIEKFGKPKTPEDLAKHNCIIFGENHAWEFKHKTTEKITKLANLEGNIKCDNGEIIKELVQSGVGLTLKSGCDIDEEVAEGKLVVLLKDYEILHKTKFYAVYPSNRYQSPKIKAFIEFFQGKLSNKI